MYTLAQLFIFISKPDFSGLDTQYLYLSLIFLSLV